MRRVFLPALPLLATGLWLSAASAAPEAGAALPVVLPAELAELPAETRLQQQVALKAVWLERLIRSREERHRITRENLSRSVLQAASLKAPAAFVDILRRLAAGNLPARERHELEARLQAMLDAYGVDTHEMRFFVEGCQLSASELREVAAWLPLHALFNILPAASEAPATAEEVAACYAELLAARRELVAIWQQVADEASANAAADALRPVLERHLSALRPLLITPEELRVEALSPFAREAAEVNRACNQERNRLLEHGWYGSFRLQVLDELLR